MKLSKTSWLLLTSGIFVIAFVGLGAISYNQAHQQDQLSKELTSAQDTLKRINQETLPRQQKELEELEERLGQATSQLEPAKEKMSSSMGSIDISSILFNIAEASGVEIVSIRLSGVGSNDLEGVPCAVQRLNGSVKGDLANLVGFIIQLNDYFPTGFVDSIIITIPETTSDEKASANIQLVTYAYQGD